MRNCKLRLEKIVEDEIVKGVLKEQNGEHPVEKKRELDEWKRVIEGGVFEKK